jgi:hypothetical protein
MTQEEFLGYMDGLGLSDDQMAAIKAAAASEKFKEKALSLRDQKELAAIEAKAADLEAKFNKAKSFEDWYAKYGPEVQANQAKLVKFQERYGDIDAATPPPEAGTMTPDQIKAMVAEQAKAFIETTQTRLSDLMIQQSKVMQKALTRKRSTVPDVEELAKIAQEKGLSLDAAYDIWDAPNMEADRKASTDAEVKRRVDEELAKRGTEKYFPGGADATPSGLSRRVESKETAPVYDRNAMFRTFHEFQSGVKQ